MMGVDLRLLPIEAVDQSFSHGVIPLERRTAAWDAFDELPSRDVPLYFNTYVARLEDGERGYGHKGEDDYGEPLKMVRAKDLRGVASRGMLEEMADMNRAAFAYLDALDGDTWVALDWW